VTITCAIAVSHRDNWCPPPGNSGRLVLGLDMGGADDVGAPGGSTTISLAPPAAKPLLHARGEPPDARSVGVGADDQDDVGVLDRVEILRARRRCRRWWQAHIRFGEWQTRAQVSTLLFAKKAGADQLLNQIGFPRWCTATR